LAPPLSSLSFYRERERLFFDQYDQLLLLALTPLLSLRKSAVCPQQQQRHIIYIVVASTLLHRRRFVVNSLVSNNADATINHKREGERESAPMQQYRGSECERHVDDNATIIHNRE
jgi:hypothetical protein